MSAELLRKAAETLRERAADAESADGGMWHLDPNRRQVLMSESSPVGEPLFTCDACHYADRGDGYAIASEETAVYIATMHPGVGLALADVLDESAAVWDDIENAPRPDSQLERMARLARLIAGDES